ncbi:MAG: DUF87 domain-containing protein [Pyrinomonadaceae bacterium]|nr:DUF87 domain-containing protein [Pyrinomonadaceae bacterium]MCX7639757.1 DUF87 domain-containing protein [Pyrinomonadaceae bacterium]MDW8304340.1 DUF87 domain-containing protein [Acidobacteriota bacterium]
MEILTSDEMMDKILELVKGAERSIKIASAWIKGRHFGSVLDSIREKEQSISLEIILRASELEDMRITDGGVFKKIRETGGKIYLCGRLHAKFILVDECKVVVGSANFTDSGLSDSKSGNLEAGTYYQGAEDDDQVKKLFEYFESIKKEHSLELNENLVGFVLNPVRPGHFEFLLLNEEFTVHSYVEVTHRRVKYLGRISSIHAHDLGFFSNPFSQSDNGATAPVEDLRRILSEDGEKSWRKAALYAYFSDNKSPFRIARAEVVCVVQEDSFSMPEYPFDAGLPVYKADKETIDTVFRSRLNGETMPLVVGKIRGTDLQTRIDLCEVLRRHMMVTGVTGAGKSHFVKTMIREILHEYTEHVQVIVLDPHGEYRQEFNDGEIYVFEEVLFPVRGDEVKELIAESGFGTLVTGNSNEAQYIKSSLEKYIRPSASKTSLIEKSLKDVLREIITNSPPPARASVSAEDKERIVKEIIDYLEEVYGEGSLSCQPEVCEKINNIINSCKSLVIVDMSRVTNSDTRTNLAGLLLQEILRQNRQDPSKKKLVVIEEAQNFAPERSYGDTSASKENLSLTTLQRLATEGRKFGIGLVVVTQRPAQVSKSVLSQMNTQVVFRTISKQNLDVLESYMEDTGRGLVELLPSFPTGVGIISGVAVPFPMVFESNDGN